MDSKFRNIFAQQSLLYTNLKSDRFRVNDRFIAALNTRNSIGIYPLLFQNAFSESIKLSCAPLLLANIKPIHDYLFCPYDSGTLVTCSKNDPLLRLWKLPNDPLDISCSVSAETDMAAVYLAGHEKRVDCFRFHPTVQGILVSASPDETIRIWDIENLTDAIQLDFIGSCSSIDFDFDGNLLAASTLDSKISIYDPRSSPSPIHTVSELHNNAKGAILKWLHPDHVILSSGFSKASQRELKLWDLRNLNAFLECYTIQEDGAGILHPHFDAALPLLYMTSRGDPIRVFEVNTSLKYVTALEKSTSMAAELLPKQFCDTSKCEIARFVKLGADQNVDLLSVHVPRVNGATVHQDDLYPPVFIHSTKAKPKEWLETNKVISPVPVLFESLCQGGTNKLETLAGLKSNQDTINSSKFNSIKKRGNATLSRSMRRQSFLAPSSAQAHSEHKHTDIERLNLLESSEKTSNSQGFSGYLELELKKWMISTWGTRFVALKSSKLYFGESPDFFYKGLNYADIREVCATGGEDSLLFLISTEASNFVFRSISKEQRDEWIGMIRHQVNAYSLDSNFTLNNSLQNINGLNERKGSINSQMPFGSKDGALLFGLLSCITSPKQNSTWQQRIVTFNSEGMIQIYSHDMSNFSSGGEPLEIFDITQAKNIHQKNEFFHISFPSRRLHFQSPNNRIAEDWTNDMRDMFGLLCGKKLSELLEGPIIYEKRTAWCMIMSDIIYLMNSEYAVSYSLMIHASNLAAVEPLASGNGLILTCLSSDNNSQTLKTIEGISKQDFQSWVEQLDSLVRCNFDFFAGYGIKSDQELQLIIDSTNLNQDMACSFIFSEALVEKGEQLILLKVHGNLNLSIQIVEFHYNSLRSDCCFLLDRGSEIYLWAGDTSSRVCRAQALNVATDIRKHRGNRLKIKLCEEDSTLSEFCRLLGVQVEILKKYRQLPSIPFCSPIARIFKVSPSRSTKKGLVIPIYEGRQPEIRMLNGVCIIEIQNEVYLWICTNASAYSKKIGLLSCKLLLEDLKQKFEFQSFHITYEKRESVIFKAKLFGYVGSLPISMRIDDQKGYIASQLEQKQIDVDFLLNPVQELEESTGLITKSLQVFKITNFSKEEVFESDYGIFWRTDSYIIVQIYIGIGGQEKCNCYFWQGSKSSITEKGTSAFITVEIAQKSGLEVNQIRMVEGKESMAFSKIFETPICILDHDCTKNHGFIGEIRQPRGHVPKLIQVKASEVRFHSQNCLIIVGNRLTYAWSGSLVNNEELHVFEWAKKRFSHNPIQLLNENVKFDDEVKLLLKNEQLASDILVSACRFEPRLFIATGKTGNVTISEIHPFIQEDLDSRAVMILDALSTIFVWFGTFSSVNEKIISMETAKSYVTKSKLHMERRSILAVTEEYQEPFEFTRCFFGWTTTKKPKESQNLMVSIRNLEQVLKEYKRDIYPIEELLSAPAEHLDKTKLEMYLSETEFQDRFKIPKSEYLEMLPWKRERIKRSVGFY